MSSNKTSSWLDLLIVLRIEEDLDLRGKSHIAEHDLNVCAGFQPHSLVKNLSFPVAQQG